jgi:uncharacterized repeat protein (TIGR03837 family)
MGGTKRWDVFCRVVDNYGDAGVCWRLARQLAAEHALDVTLWIDRLATLARFEPGVDAEASRQSLRGVTLRRLRAEARPSPLPDVVIEGFGCGLPPAHIAAMAASAAPPLWINLEYLSAEPWVDTVHGLASPQPKLPLERFFWFPGFTARTGGLIREAGLLEARAAAQSPPAADEPMAVTLFCYPNRALPALFDTWSEADEPLRCAIPEGVATAALDQWLHGDVPHAGQSVDRGRLTLDVIPFGTQDAFDRMLWRSTVNFVRGEDSFVRAQWAARAFVWQPYPQDERAHTLKMDAFLARYAADLPAGQRAALTDFWQAFNDEDGIATARTWPAFRAAAAALSEHGRRWAATLAALPEMTAGLVDFAARRL